MNKKGTNVRAMLAILGSILFLLGLYILNTGEILYAAMAGIIGILTITISLLPLIKGTSKKQ